MFKADVFIGHDDAWSRAEMERGRIEEISLSSGTVLLRFATVEDVVLHKLKWYRLGGEMSDRQWQDILGMLRIQGPTVDLVYLRRWAPVLDVADLLARATATS